MAKALIGHLERGSRPSALLEVDNARLRARVGDLEALVRRLAEENDVLAARAAGLDAHLEVRADDEALQPA